jgi:hypothetical protein
MPSRSPEPFQRPTVAGIQQTAQNNVGQNNLANLAQAYAQPHQAMQPRTGGWDGQGPNTNPQHSMQQPMQQGGGLQGFESRISPELMQFLQPFLNQQNGGLNQMRGLLGFQPIEHNPFEGQKGLGGGLYGG